MASLGNFVDRVGTALRLPEFGISEMLNKGKPTVYTGVTKQSQAAGARYNPSYSGTVGTSYAQPASVRQPVQQGQVASANTQYTGGGGGGGGGGGYNVDNYQQLALQQGKDVNSPEFDRFRQQEQERSNRGLEAALGVFNAQKQGIMNRIPGLESARDLRIRGLDEGLGQFNQTADTEMGKRITGLQGEQQGINEEYTRAGRTVRNASKSLSNELRNMFAGLGTLDSTQYRDMSFDQKSNILQSLGDIGREKSGKITANIKEQGDTQDFYSKQKLAEQQRIALEKDKVKAEADSLIQGVLSDANLSDAQKIEAVTEAQNRLGARMSELDQAEMNFKQQSAKDAQDFALRIASLQNKGASDSYTQAKSQTQALENMTSILEKYRNDDGSLALSSEGIKSVARQVGFPEEELDQVSQFFGVPIKKKTTSSNPFE